ncbi:ricin-type beta-trefoil lectin domain protein [Leucobacter viscericola]|uniref:Ricin-type beta-trefoil lectin domain protein n=1 Tax=Leucobacter viscericola TaxID=2714935 RepID=A0A6G7XF25_9MICO|nr:ricin-type beta-trefoil lectin domain protein [Leucobacter viscericola]QIK63112.1 ricin-type beta-trefoil lectin domain protein [Leucobacter viscericola]
MTRTTSSLTRHLVRGAAIAALSLASVLAGSTAHAATDPDVTVGGVVKAAQLSASVTGFNNATMRLSDDGIAMPFTVTNTTTTASTQKAKTSTRLTSTGQVFGTSWVWPVSNAAACPVNAEIGGGSTLLMWPVNTTLTKDLAPGESQTYCFRTMRTGNLGSSTGTVSANINVAATLSLGNFQTTAQSSATLATKAIFPNVTPVDNWYNLKPLGQSWCFDVTGGVNATAGSLIGTYTCHPSTDVMYGNQWFSFKPVTNGFAIRPKGPAGTSLQPSGSSLVAQTTNAALKEQAWTIQQSSPTTYQIVNLASGLCVSAPPSFGNLSLAICDDLNVQKFVYSKVNVAIPTMAELTEPAAGTEKQPETATGAQDPEGSDEFEELETAREPQESQGPETPVLDEVPASDPALNVIITEGRDPAEAIMEDQDA